MVPLAFVQCFMSLVVVIFDGEIEGVDGYPIVALFSFRVRNEGKEFGHYLSDVNAVISDESKD